MNGTDEMSGGIKEYDITFPAKDGYELAGRLIVPAVPRAAVLISPATGLPKEFYAPFARFGATRGVASLLFDYRGVGASAPKDFRSFEMDYPDWGRLDMPAALDRLIEAVPGAPVVHIGTSVGGHFAGFMSNHDRIQRHIFISVGLGTWWKHRFPNQQLLDLFFWWLYGPYRLMTRGYIPAGGLWGGSTLPAGVFRTWRRWSHKGSYFGGELENRLQPHYFAELSATIISYVFTDDPLTTVDGANAFLSFLPNAKKEVRVRRPPDLGVRSLGHQNLFRAYNAAAWGEIWDAALE